MTDRHVSPLAAAFAGLRGETDANTITAAASCVQAAVLVGAAVVAVRQVSEARRLREEQAQPYVVVSLETDASSPFMLNLVIKNIGRTAARNVVVDFDPPLVSSIDKLGDPSRITEWTALTDGIPTLVPGQAMSTMLDSLFQRYSSKDQYPGRTQATVRYAEDHDSNKVYSYNYDLDFNVFFGMHWVGSKSFDDLVKAIEGVQGTMKSWTTDNGLKAYTKDFDERVKEASDRRVNVILERKIDELR
ncbi:MAG TPA: hypothetical protein VGM79_10720, partial [Streptosporangiaceae bacterium]